MSKTTAYPRLRAWDRCPLCPDPKPRGALACVRCTDARGIGAGDDDPYADKVFATAEATLIRASRAFERSILRRVAAVAATLAVIVCLLPSGASARGRHHAHHRGGHHYVCGITQARYFGLRDPDFALALHWATLPHTDPHPGAVVVQRRAGRAEGGSPGGHVSRIVEVTGRCRAIVTDDRGTYSRDICRALVAYVQP
jgi:hypothetical protein